MLTWYTSSVELHHNTVLAAAAYKHKCSCTEKLNDFSFYITPWVEFSHLKNRNNVDNSFIKKVLDTSFDKVFIDIAFNSDGRYVIEAVNERQDLLHIQVPFVSHKCLTTTYRNI